MKKLLPILLLVLVQTSFAQERKEAAAYFSMIKDIVRTETSVSRIVPRLDSLKSAFIPSRSYVNDYLNREIDFGIKHKRILVSLNLCSYRIDLLLQQDTVLLKSITATAYPEMKFDDFDRKAIDQFLTKRNKLYHSSKTTGQLLKELSMAEEFALTCGDGDPQTEKYIYIGQLVSDGDEETLISMLKSFSCETQAYAVTGLDMLEKNGHEIPSDIQQLIRHIKKRNAPVVTCSGCLSGIVDIIYPVK